MATFYNRATLSYNGNNITSNITVGEITEVLSASKTAVTDRYSEDDEITYIVNIVNSGSTSLSGLTVTDDLGAYTCGENTAVPLEYINGSLKYFVNGVLQPVPAFTAGDSLVITDITVPANGNTTLVYTVRTNEFAPLGIEDSITNTAVISGPGVCEDITATETIFTSPAAKLSISKCLCPSVITECGRVTYTFIIQNTGNVPADVSYNTVVSDTFDPTLSDIAVTFNGIAWTAGTNYMYDAATGVFATVPGQITVPAATYTTDPDTCAITIDPGISTLTVSGNIGCCL